MKSFFRTAAIVVSSLFLTVSATAQIQSATLKASGLTCSMCSKAIYKSLQKVSTIQTVDVNIETSEYTISFKPGTTVDLDDVKEAVESAGFSVAAMQVRARMESSKLGKDSHVKLGESTFHFLNGADKTLDGDVTFKVVDKAYLPPAVHKEYGELTSMKCYQTGYMESCCAGGKPSGAPQRVYHAVL